MHEKSYKNIPIYYFGYKTMKYSKNVKTNSINLLFLVFGKVNENFQKRN